MGRRVTIVGGGIIGLCSALYGARRGHEVLLLDAGPEGFPGCSHGNAGMVVPSHVVPLAAPGMVGLGLKWMWNPESPFYIKPRWNADLIRWGLLFWRAANAGHVRRSAPLLRDLHLRSRACFESLASEPGLEFGLEKRGLLMLCKTQHGLDEEARAAETARALGIPAEVLDSRQTGQLDPTITMDVAGSVYFPKDCHLNPGRLIAAILVELKRRGVRFAWETEVLSWNCDGNKIRSINTSKGVFEGDMFVLAAGSWTPSVARDLGLQIPMQAGKGYSLTLPRPRQLPQLCSILTEARVAVTPMGAELRFGGTMEIAGLDTRIHPLRVQGIIKAAARYFPEFSNADFEGVRPWAGLRPCSPDGLPYLGRARRQENLVVATGHSMMGLSLGPVTGEIVAALLSGEEPGLDLTLLAPDRFG